MIKYAPASQAFGREFICRLGLLKILLQHWSLAAWYRIYGVTIILYGVRGFPLGKTGDPIEVLVIHDQYAHSCLWFSYSFQNLFFDLRS